MTVEPLIDEIPEEPVSRVLTSSKQYNVSRTRAGAWLPPKVKLENKMETELKRSVYLFRGCSKSEIFEIASRIELPKEGKLHGIGTVNKDVIEYEDLSLDVDNDPVRHAHIVGWPKKKFDRMDIALELAKASRRELFEDWPIALPTSSD